MWPIIACIYCLSTLCTQKTLEMASVLFGAGDKSDDFFFWGPAGTRVSGHVGFSASSVASVRWLNCWILPVAPPPPYGTTLVPAVQPPTKS